MHAPPSRSLALACLTYFLGACDASPPSAPPTEDDGSLAAAGVRGTPYFVIGRTGADGVIEGMPIRGAQPLDVFRRAIDAALAQDTLESRKRSPGGTP